MNLIRRRVRRVSPSLRSPSLRSPSRALCLERLEQRRLLVGDIDLRLEFTSLDGGALDSLSVGQQFILRGHVRDARGVPAGISQAYFDISYPSAIATPTGNFAFGSTFLGDTSGDTNTPGLLNEVGAADTDQVAPNPPGAEALLFSLPMQAQQAGTLSFSASPPSEMSNTIFFLDARTTTNIGLLNGSISVVNASLTFTAATSDVAEGAGRQVSVTLNLAPGQTLAQAVSVTVSAVGVSAGNSDFSLSNATLTFPAGSGNGVTRSATVNAANDTAVEGLETLELRLAGLNDPNGLLALGDGVHTVTIQDTDTATIRFAAASSNANEGNASHQVPVRLEIPGGGTLERPVSFNVTATGTTADSGDFALTSPTTLTFNAGAQNNAQVFAVLNIANDDLVEGVETLGLALSGLNDGTGGRVTLDNGPHQVSIADGDSATVVFAAPSSSVDEAAGNHSVVATLSIPNGATLQRSVTARLLSPASADFSVGNQQVQFAAGAANGASQSFTLAVNDDDEVEGNESFALGLEVVSGPATATTAEHQLTIVDNDIPTVSFSQATSSVAEEAGTHSITVVLGLPAGTTLTQSVMATVELVAAGATASAPGDFALATSTVMFPAGAGNGTTATVVLNLVDDLVVEPNEIVRLRLVNPTNMAVIGAAGEHAATIVDSDTTTLTLESPPPTDEGTSAAATTQLDFVVRLSNPVQGGLATTFATSDGTALAGSDYVAASGPLSFTGTAGETRNFSVQVVQDDRGEANETLSVALSGVTGVPAGVSDRITVVNSPATVTIRDDDAASVRLTPALVSRNEGNSGVTQFEFDVELSGDVPGGFQVAFATSDGTAVAGSDYTANASSLSFSGTAGETRRITIAVAADATVEPDEEFFVTLGAASGLGPGVVLVVDDTPAVGRILNDDSAQITLTSAAPARMEGASGTVEFAFSVTLTAPVQGGFELPFSTQDGSAIAGADYERTEGSLAFAGGPETQTITVRVFGDNTVELDEQFTVALGIPDLDAAVLADIAIDGPLAATILNDDEAQLSVEAVDGAEGGANAVFTIRLTSPASTDLTVSYTVSGSAAAPDDFPAPSGTAVIPAGETSVTVTLQIADDPLVEPDEFVTLTLDSVDTALPVTISPQGGSATAAIVDNDAAVVGIVVDRDAEETNSAGAFLLTLSKASSADTVVTYRVDGTAGATDFEALSGTAVIPAGATSLPLAVLPIIDFVIEGDETVVVTLESVSGNDAISLDGAASQATLVIQDDDSGEITVEVQQNGSELGDAVIFAIRQDGIVGVDTVIEFSLAGTAAAGVDYTAPSVFRVTIAANSTFAQVAIPVLDDLDIEGPETLEITLDRIASGDPLVFLADSPVAVAAINDDDTAEVVIAAVREGSEIGPVSGRFEIRQSGVATVDTVVSYTVSGSAAPGQDYSALSGMATIAAGATSVVVSVDVVNDTLVEPLEDVVVTLDAIVSGADVVTIGSQTSARLTIESDDASEISITAGSAGREAGPVNSMFIVTLTNPSSTDTVLALAVSGTASNGVDFAALPTQLTIPAGATRVELPLAVVDDRFVEGAESVTVTLANIVSGNDQMTLGAANAATLQVLDNDSATVEFETGASTAFEFNGRHVVRVALRVAGGGTIAQPLNVLVTVTGGTATPTGDFTLITTRVTFPAGSADGDTRDVELTLVDDQNPGAEDDESIQLGLSIEGEPQGDVTLGAAQHQITLTSDPMTAVLQGRVWVDADRNGARNGAEATIPGVVVLLIGVDQSNRPVEMMTTTDALGEYAFTNLPAGRYNVIQVQPEPFLDAAESPGSVEGRASGVVGENRFDDIEVGPAEHGSGYDFGEAGLKSRFVSSYLILASNRGRQPQRLSEIMAQSHEAAGQPAIAAAIRTDRVADFRRIGSEITIQASSRNDLIEVIPAGVSPSVHPAARADAVVVITNGEVKAFPVNEVTRISLSGGAGQDQLVLYDSPGNDALTSTRDEVILQTPNFRVEAMAFELIRAVSRSGGQDTVNLSDDLLSDLVDLEGNWV